MEGIVNKFLTKRNIIIFFLASVLLLISTLIFTNFEIIAYRVNTIISRIKMESVDVDGFEISQVIIDENNNEYNSSYSWNATDYYERKTFTLQINYKKTNNKSYEAGDLVLIVPNIFTRQSYIYDNSNTWSSNRIVISSDPCSLDEKSTTWSYSSDETKCSSYTRSDYFDNLYFSNNEKIDANTNFEGSIRIMYYLIEPIYVKNGLDNSFHVSLNNKINSNNIRFRFTSNRKNLTVTASPQKISG